MKHPFKNYILAVFLTFSAFLNAEIIEVKEFKEILCHIHPESLVLLDIDDTLLIPVQTLGTDVWFIYRLESYLNSKNDPLRALDCALADWEAVRHLTKVRLVEEGTDQIVEKIQNNRIRVMGLTTQGLALTSRTTTQLKSLLIDLSLTAPSKEDYYFINGKNGVLYKDGILFTAGTSKGDAILKFLDNIKYHPKHIVFINDKKTHLQDVEKSVVLRNIDFIGLRYSYSDERVANFSKEIADLQWANSTFGHLLSDKEAITLLNSSK